jgi:hypothetical protein
MLFASTGHKPIRIVPLHLSGEDSGIDLSEIKGYFSTKPGEVHWRSMKVDSVLPQLAYKHLKR